MESYSRQLEARNNSSSHRKLIFLQTPLASSMWIKSRYVRYFNLEVWKMMSSKKFRDATWVASSFPVNARCWLSAARRLKFNKPIKCFQYRYCWNNNHNKTTDEVFYEQRVGYGRCNGTLRMSLSSVYFLFSISPGQDDAQSLFGLHSTRASREENIMSKTGKQNAKGLDCATVCILLRILLCKTFTL